MQLTKAYNHKNVESKWYAHWINSGAFRPSKGKGPTFSMVIPPPNVTGSLHVGHALWSIRYPLADDPSRALVVATTRLETMLGDTAVAVHPEDNRYQQFAGRKIRLPITVRVVPLLSDPHVDQTFGTGALKIAPGHDFNDFEIGECFGLDRISIFDADARIDGSGLISRGEKGNWTSLWASFAEPGICAWK